MSNATTSKNFIPLSEPFIDDADAAAVAELVRGGWVSTLSPTIDEFEKKVASFIGVPHASALQSGTTALHLANIAAGVKPGDVVLCPTLTFIATANAVSYTGAEPVFIDCSSDSMNMCPDLVEQYLEKNKSSGKRVAAIVVTHVLGHVADMDRLNAIGRKWGVPVIEDAAESFGSAYKGKLSGGLGTIGCLSFNGNKLMTTGSGGMVLSSDKAIVDRVRHLSTQAKKDSFMFVHDEIGFNARMNGLSAALGLSQLAKFKKLLETRRWVAEEYRSRFMKLDGVTFVDAPAHSESNFWLSCVLVDPSKRDVLLRELPKAGIGVRPLWTLSHEQAVYRDHEFYGPQRNSRKFYDRAVCLPSSCTLTVGELDTIVNAFKKVLGA